MRTRSLSFLMLALLAVACGDSGADTGVPIDTDSVDTAADVATFDADVGTPEDTDSADAGDVPEDSDPSDSTPDAADPGGCVGGGLGCPCTDDEQCADGPCVAIGFDGLRICSEFCDGGCSEPGFACQSYNVDGREVNACFPIQTYCEPCAETAACGSEVNVCLNLTDGEFCASSCEWHGYCPDGATCRAIDDGGLSRRVCVPDAGVCAACLDPDDDGYGVGAECSGPDCSPDDASAHQDAPELCDGRDNDCDLDVDEGFDLSNDPANCGACGTGCVITNASPACREGRCGIGACLAGFADCDADAANGCETDLLSPLLCGACGPIDGTPGEVCGTCGSGEWTCNEEQAADCVGDLGRDALNACGSCGELEALPGTVCGDCSRWVCDVEGGVACEVAEDALNACGGCGELAGAPGSSCGECGGGEWACAGGDAVCEGGSDSRNACGGCSTLEAAPETACGPCDLDSWICDGTDGVRCDGATVGNACDGCRPLDDEPGDECGRCGLDVFECDGTEDVSCNGDTVSNECGGCGDLIAAVGDACGACDGGTWSCNGPEALACLGGDGRNLCGGCSELSAAPGDPCGPCADGAIVCNGTEATRCADASPDPDEDGLCGDDDLCPGGDDTADADEDGVPDACDDCPFDDPDDSDDDGVCDSDDICAGDDTVDSDEDGVPDACDDCPFDDPDDSDDDGVCDTDDICAGSADDIDADEDGVPDGCDICEGGDDGVDDDEDDVPNFCDVCEGGRDDEDDDADTVPNFCDVCPGGDDRVDLDGNGTPDDCDSTGITPGNTTNTAEYGGWSVRCIEWSGDTCVHMQQSVSCATCSTYPHCDQWHDVTPFNNGSDRTPLNWCMIATGSNVLISVGTGAATAVHPFGCGYSGGHPACRADHTSIAVPGASTDTALGLLVNPTYCGNSTNLLTVECGGW